MDAVFADRVFGQLSHHFTSRIRRTDVRPMSNRRAISALLTPVAIEFPGPMPSTSRGSGRWGISARVPARDLIWLVVAQRTQHLASVNVMQHLLLWPTPIP